MQPLRNMELSSFSSVIYSRRHLNKHSLYKFPLLLSNSQALTPAGARESDASVERQPDIFKAGLNDLHCNFAEWNSSVKNKRCFKHPPAIFISTLGVNIVYALKAYKQHYLCLFYTQTYTMPARRED